MNEQPQFEFKLRGNPWAGDVDDPIMNKQMAKLVFEVIDTNFLRIYLPISDF